MTMHLPRRARFAVAALLAVSLAGCGVKATTPTAAKVDTGGGSSSPTTQATAPTTAPPVSTDGSSPDTSESPPSTAGDGTGSSIPSLGAGELATAKAQIISAYEQAGLSKTQATCLADKLVDKFGSGANPATDYSSILSLLGDCHISLSQLGGFNPGG